MTTIAVSWPFAGRPLWALPGDRFATMDGADRLVIGRDGDVLRQGGHTQRVSGLHVRGETVVSVADDGVVRAWWPGGADHARPLADWVAPSAILAPDGATVWWSCHGTGAHAWDLATGADREVPANRFAVVGATSTGDVVLLAGDTELRRVDGVTGKAKRLVLRAERPHVGGVLAGDVIWGGGSQGGGRLFFFAPGAKTPIVAEVGNALMAVATSPDGRWIAAWSVTEGVRVFQAPFDGPPRHLPDVRAEEIAVNDDGTLVVAAGNEIRVIGPDGRSGPPIDGGARVRKLACAQETFAAGVGDGWVADRVLIGGLSGAS